MRMSNEAEEILETLWKVSQEQGRLTGLDELRVEESDATLSELVRLGCVAVSDDHVTLSETGLKEAEGAVRRHRLAERLMVDVLDLRSSLVEENACLFEHLLRRDVEESICTLLGHPTCCPHGRPIPGGACCKRKGETGTLVATVADAKKGAKGRVAYLHTDDSGRLQKLMAMGMLPGVRLEVLQRFPSFLLRVGNSEFAIDEQMARGICVRLAR